MKRDYGKEIDELKVSLEEIKQLLGKSGKPAYAGRVEKTQNMLPDPAIISIHDQWVDNCSTNGGRVTYFGVFAADRRQSSWIRNEVNTDDLLALIRDNTAGKVLATVGNNDRLRLLLAILQKSLTVAQMVEECGYNSTGQVYHHLKPLIAVDLVAEDPTRKGYYVIQPHRVQGIVMLLAGISDIIDPSYTQGNWDE